MRKLALIAVGATALPLLAAGPSLAQQNGAKPQSQMQPKMQMQQPQKAAASIDQSQIRQVQQALDQKGFNAGRADGRLGPRTKTALNKFQEKQGLQRTGEPDGQTLAALGIGGASTTGQGQGQSAPAQKQSPNPNANQSGQPPSSGGKK